MGLRARLESINGNRAVASSIFAMAVTTVATCQHVSALRENRVNWWRYMTVLLLPYGSSSFHRFDDQFQESGIVNGTQ